MKPEQLIDAIGGIDSRYIEEAGTRKRRRSSARWLHPIAAAACLALLVGVGLPFLPRRTATAGGAGTSEELLSPEKGTSYYLHELRQLWGERKLSKGMTVHGLAIIKPWESLSDLERYRTLRLGDATYVSRFRTVSLEYIGEYLGDGEGIGEESGLGPSNKEHRCSFQVFQIKDLDPEDFVAVSMEGEFVVFSYDYHDGSNRPATLGEAWERLNLPATVDLSYFSVGQGYSDKSYYTCADDTLLWQLLSTCRDLPTLGYEEGRGFRLDLSKREYISFSIVSERLGIYKYGMYITKDGYLDVPFPAFSCCYEIGEELAARLIEAAMAEAAETEQIPYRSSIASIVTEVGEDYLIVDDTSMCEDPSDGRSFRILINTQKMRHLVANDRVKVGHAILVEFEGKVLIDEEYVIDSAVALYHGTLTDDGVIVILE